MIQLKHLSLILFFAINCIVYSAQAQITGFYGDLIQQADSTQRADMISMLDSINTTGLNDSLNNSGVLDSLRSIVNGKNPLLDLDSLTSEWSFSRDSFLSVLSNSNFDSLDRVLALAEFDRINDIWFDELDSLRSVFDDYQDSLRVVDIKVNNPPDLQFVLENDISAALDTIPAVGFTDAETIFNQLFNADLFSRLEMAYGRKATDVHYYGSTSALNLDHIQVLRIGSVPGFNTTWEAQWHFMVSWTNDDSWQNESIETQASLQSDNGFDPFVLEGNFSTMFNPQLWSAGNVGIRLITGLGVSVNTYAPSHASYNGNTVDNIGYTTECGPEVTTGFALNIGDAVSTYAMARSAYGIVGNSPDYNYRSLVFESGIRFGNSINIRYMTGEQNWAPDANKRIATNHQFTIGLILSSLFR